MPETSVWIADAWRGQSVDALGALSEPASSIESTAAAVGAAGSRLAEVEWEARALAAIVEIASKLAASKNLKAGCFQLVNGLRDAVGCEQAAVGLALEGSKHCRLIALSGMADVDQRSQLAQSLEAAFDESLLRAAPVCVGGDAAAAEAGALAHAQLRGIWENDAVLSCPLQTAEGRLVGSVIIRGADETICAPHTRQFLAAAAEPWAEVVDALRRAERKSWGTALAGMLSPRRWLNRKRACIAALATAAILAIPLPYKLRCDCQIEPTVRRFVAAPHDGIFETSLAKPGDLVKRDQVLGRLDGKEIRWELAGLTADQERAGKSRDVNLAADKVAAAQIDRLEMDRLNARRRLLEERTAHLEIKSPLDGVVIAGDLERSQGVPVTMGQPLYEIAPLEAMLAEVAVADEEIAMVREGQAVSIRLDAYPGSVWPGTVRRIEPRAEVREGENIFVAEVLLPNSTQTMRPGMKGTAKIVAGHHSVAWLLLHRPWSKMRNWLGW